MHTPDQWKIRWLDAIDKVERAQWDALAFSLPTPLLEWQWLQNLESSGSISPRHGWQPNHLTIWQGQQLIGAAPLYLKNHSEGEFIFDYWWAQLAREHEVAYYPKLVGMSPATPSIGYRFLMADDVEQSDLMQIMLTAIDQQCQDHKVPQCSLNFVDTQWFDSFSSPGFVAWHHQSYLWKNRNFTCFDDYLKIFKSSQRRNIRREMKTMEKHGITIHALTGETIPEGLWELMYRYYLNTNDRYGLWAARFLNGNFFRLVFQDYRHRLLILAAHQESTAAPIALSMLLLKDRHLIGRYWGCATPVKDLHFNMCFYAPIQWAIENNIKTFDPGVGSPHKIARGFAAVPNTSLHRLYDPHLRFIFEQLIDKVNEVEAANIVELNQQLPFARRPDSRL